MKELSKLQLCVYNTGGILLVIGALLPVFFDEPLVAPYLYIVGTLMFASMQILQRYNGKNVVLRRLRRQQMLGAIVLLLAGMLMFCSFYKIGPLHTGEWQILLSIGAVLEIYTAFRIPAELDKKQ